MSPLFQLPGAVKRDPAIADWTQRHPTELGDLAARWFAVMRDCGADVREILHDGQATACVGEAAFAYVAVFKAHVNVGFFLGKELPDRLGLLEGTGRLMRHVKLRADFPVETKALHELIRVAYAEVKERVAKEARTGR